MKIDILIPTYDGSKYICEQIDSILAQDYKDFNIIIKDDKSRDNTFDLICDKYGHINNITILSSDENQGYQQNYIDLMVYSNADLVMLCDQDDVWRPNKISTILNHPNINDKYLMISNDARVVDANLNVISKTYAGAYCKQESIYSLTYCNHTQGCAITINKKLKDLFLLYRTGLPYDWHINFVAKALGAKYYIDEQLQDYRRHNSNTTSILSVDNLDFINRYRVFDIIYSAPVIGTFITIINILKEAIDDQLPKDTEVALGIFQKIKDKKELILNNLTIEDANVETKVTCLDDIVNFYNNLIDKLNQHNL